MLIKTNFQFPTSNFLFLKTEGHVFSNPLYQNFYSRETSKDRSNSFFQSERKKSTSVAVVKKSEKDVFFAQNTLSSSSFVMDNAVLISKEELEQERAAQARDWEADDSSLATRRNRSLSRRARECCCFSAAEPGIARWPLVRAREAHTLPVQHDVVECALSSA